MSERLNKEIISFDKKDFAGKVYRAIAYCLTACGLLLLIQKTIASDILYLGIIILSIIIGASLLVCYIFNARTRFRPGWTLPMSIILMMTGTSYLAFKTFLKAYMPTTAPSTVVLCLIAINFVLLVSTGIQLKSLCLKRWIAIVLLSVLNLAVAFLIFFDVFTLRANDVVCFSIFMFLIALQSFLEGLFNWTK